MLISVHPDRHGWSSATTGEGTWDGVAEIITISIVIMIIKTGATKLFSVGSIGYFHPVIVTNSVPGTSTFIFEFNVKTLKGQLNDASFWRLQCPYFIIIVVII